MESNGYKEKVIGEIKFELSEYIGLINQEKNFELLKCPFANSIATIQITI